MQLASGVSYWISGPEPSWISMSKDTSSLFSCVEGEGLTLTDPSLLYVHCWE
uniref:Uncharacterized protein n=1 Tax=Arundo donax TaxID=35708 RepID=A0A0A9GGD2_ARUDO